MQTPVKDYFKGLKINIKSVLDMAINKKTTNITIDGVCTKQFIISDDK